MKMIVSLLVDDLRGFEYYKPKSKITFFCKSTQPLGPLFLWQCLVFLFFPIDILHLSKKLVPLFSFYFSSTRKAPNNGVLLCPFVVIQLFPHNPTIYVARAPLQLLRSLVKLYLSMWLSVCQGSVTPDHWHNLRLCQYSRPILTQYHQEFLYHQVPTNCCPILTQYTAPSPRKAQLNQMELVRPILHKGA